MKLEDYKCEQPNLQCDLAPGSSSTEIQIHAVPAACAVFSVAASGGGQISISCRRFLRRRLTWAPVERRGTRQGTGGRQGAANPLPAGEIPPRPQKGRRGVIRPCPTPAAAPGHNADAHRGGPRWLLPGLSWLDTVHGLQSGWLFSLFLFLFFLFFFVFGCLIGRLRLVVLVGTHWARFG